MGKWVDMPGMNMVIKEVGLNGSGARRFEFVMDETERAIVLTAEIFINAALPDETVRFELSDQIPDNRTLGICLVNLGAKLIGNIGNSLP